MSEIFIKDSDGLRDVWGLIRPGDVIYFREGVYRVPDLQVDKPENDIKESGE